MSKHEFVCETVNATVTHCSVNMSELLWPDVAAFAFVFGVFAVLLWV